MGKITIPAPPAKFKSSSDKPLSLSLIRRVRQNITFGDNWHWVSAHDTVIADAIAAYLPEKKFGPAGSTMIADLLPNWFLDPVKNYKGEEQNYCHDLREEHRFDLDFLVNSPRFVDFLLEYIEELQSELDNYKGLS